MLEDDLTTFYLAKKADSSTVVQPWRQYGQQVIQ